MRIGPTHENVCKAVKRVAFSLLIIRVYYNYISCLHREEREKWQTLSPLRKKSASSQRLRAFQFFPPSNLTDYILAALSHISVNFFNQ